MSREDEIDILKLVGATRRFIGFPFIIGGALQGIAGFLVGSGILWLLYWIVETRIRALEFFPIDPAFLTSWRASLLLGLGFLIGVIGSASAVTRAIRRM
jgi:cell division transport system permease protein